MNLCLIPGEMRKNKHTNLRPYQFHQGADKLRSYISISAQGLLVGYLAYSEPQGLLETL